MGLSKITAGATIAKFTAYLLLFCYVVTLVPKTASLALMWLAVYTGLWVPIRCLHYGFSRECFSIPFFRVEYKVSVDSGWQSLDSLFASCARIPHFMTGICSPASFLFKPTITLPGVSTMKSCCQLLGTLLFKAYATLDSTAKFTVKTTRNILAVARFFFCNDPMEVLNIAHVKFALRTRCTRTVSDVRFPINEGPALAKQGQSSSGENPDRLKAGNNTAETTTDSNTGHEINSERHLIPSAPTSVCGGCSRVEDIEESRVADSSSGSETPTFLGETPFYLPDPSEPVFFEIATRKPWLEQYVRSGRRNAGTYTIVYEDGERWTTSDDPSEEDTDPIAVEGLTVAGTHAAQETTPDAVPTSATKRTTQEHSPGPAETPLKSILKKNSKPAKTSPVLAPEPSAVPVRPVQLRDEAVNHAAELLRAPQTASSTSHSAKLSTEHAKNPGLGHSTDATQPASIIGGPIAVPAAKLEDEAGKDVSTQSDVPEMAQIAQHDAFLSATYANISQSVQSLRYAQAKARPMPKRPVRGRWSPYGSVGDKPVQAIIPWILGLDREAMSPPATQRAKQRKTLRLKKDYTASTESKKINSDQASPRVCKHHKHGLYKYKPCINSSRTKVLFRACKTLKRTLIKENRGSLTCRGWQFMRPLETNPDTVMRCSEHFLEDEVEMFDVVPHDADDGAHSAESGMIVVDATPITTISQTPAQVQFSPVQPAGPGQPPVPVSSQSISTTSPSIPVSVSVPTGPVASLGPVPSKYLTPAQPSTQSPAQPSTQSPAQPSTQSPAQPSTQSPVEMQSPLSTQVAATFPTGSSQPLGPTPSKYITPPQTPTQSGVPIPVQASALNSLGSVASKHLTPAQIPAHLPKPMSTPTPEKVAQTAATSPTTLPLSQMPLPTKFTPQVPMLPSAAQAAATASPTLPQNPTPLPAQPSQPVQMAQALPSLQTPSPAQTQTQSTSQPSTAGASARSAEKQLWSELGSGTQSHVNNMAVQRRKGSTRKQSSPFVSPPRRTVSAGIGNLASQKASPLRQMQTATGGEESRPKAQQDLATPTVAAAAVGEDTSLFVSASVANIGGASELEPSNLNDDNEFLAPFPVNEEDFVSDFRLKPIQDLFKCLDAGLKPWADAESFFPSIDEREHEILVHHILTLEQLAIVLEDNIHGQSMLKLGLHAAPKLGNRCSRLVGQCDTNFHSFSWDSRDKKERVWTIRFREALAKTQRSCSEYNVYEMKTNEKLRVARVNALPAGPPILDTAPKILRAMERSREFIDAAKQSWRWQKYIAGTFRMPVDIKKLISFGDDLRELQLSSDKWDGYRAELLDESIDFTASMCDLDFMITLMKIAQDALGKHHMGTEQRNFLYNTIIPVVEVLKKASAAFLE